MSPYSYQLTIAEFLEEWGMSVPTYQRRRADAKRYYPNWPKVFLTDHRVDIREYQNMMTYLTELKWEQKKNPHLKYKKRGRR